MFKKFGTSDDQRLDLDREEDCDLHKSASADTRWSQEDAEALRRENEQ